MNNRLPPQSLETEKVVLGCMIQDLNAAIAVFGLLQDETVFVDDKHRLIYNATKDLYRRNDPIDITMVSNELEANKKLTKAGGSAYLAEIIGLVDSPVNAETYARTILGLAQRRMAIHLLTQGVDKCYDQSTPINEQLELLIANLLGLSHYGRMGGARLLGQFMQEAYVRLGNIKESPGGVIGVPSGFSGLDALTGGFQNGDLIVLAGRPSLGKTTFCMNLITYPALKYKIPTAIFSLEMSGFQVAVNAMSCYAGLNSHLVRQGKIGQDVFKKLSDTVSVFCGAPIYLDDTSGITISEIKARCRKLQMEFGVKQVAVDYIGLIKEDSNCKGKTRNDIVGYWSRTLKDMAKEMEIPIIMISQLSRKTEMRAEKRPELQDLRESGNIEQDADVVMFIYRQWDKELKGLSPHTEIIVEKQRCGPTGIAHLYFERTTGKFTELSNQPEEDPPY